MTCLPQTAGATEEGAARGKGGAPRGPSPLHTCFPDRLLEMQPGRSHFSFNQASNEVPRAPQTLGTEREHEAQRRKGTCPQSAPRENTNQALGSPDSSRSTHPRWARPVCAPCPAPQAQCLTHIGSHEIYY